MENPDLIALLLIGLVTGLVGGLLGIGGSIVLIPAMTEVLGPDQHLYQATAMIVNFFVVVPAVYQHRRAQAIDPAVVVRVVPLALLAVVVGVGLSELPLFSGEREVYLRGLFGLFILFVAVTDLRRLIRPGSRDDRNSGVLGGGLPPTDRMRWRALTAVAVPTGLIAGLFGVGGGIVAVPLQRRLLGIPIRSAIANSATIIVATSFVGALTKNYAYAAETGKAAYPLILAALVIPMAMVGSLIGSRATHRLPVAQIRTAFFLLLTVAAIRLIYSAAQSL